MSKKEISWRPSWISANEWPEKNGTNSSFKVKGVKIPKSLSVKNIAKIPSGLHNPLHYINRSKCITIQSIANY